MSRFHLSNPSRKLQIRQQKPSRLQPNYIHTRKFAFFLEPAAFDDDDTELQQEYRNADDAEIDARNSISKIHQCIHAAAKNRCNYE